ncbi:HAL/PAL/TAL family ammonia-lyase [Variovorax sp. HJSM1_2]|uniref:HAL/PAL/TAL family ammonia-lyase n=1 Tax=Variovorax sp. HJSM1_2 TaxID=3366263 RepID=UPI003BBAC667
MQAASASAGQAATAVLLGPGPVTIEHLLRVAQAGAPVCATPEVAQRLRIARAVVDQLAASSTPIYGLNSALGANVGQAIDPAQQAAYQVRAIQARSVGVGPEIGVERVRATLFSRLAGLAVGGSGISPEVFDALLALLNAGVHPVVPALGSIGVADLAPMSHAMQVLLGAGEADFCGERLPGGEALRRAGLAPAQLGPKDGLALISSNAFTVGGAALAWQHMARVLDLLDFAAVLTLEGFRANLSPFCAEAVAARPTPGVQQSAERLVALLDGSALWQSGAARRVQDPLSLRCVPQIHGAAWWALEDARQHIEAELNGAGDSPLVLPEGAATEAAQGQGRLISTSNFHIPGLVLSLEGVGLAFAQAASAVVQRCQRLYSPGSSGLPLQLTRLGPEHSGFATIQKTLTALWSEVRHLANPACLDFFPVSETSEDHALMAPQVVEKTQRLGDAVAYLACIELLSAAQAVDLRGITPDQMGAGARRIYTAVRALLPPLDEDRPLGPEVELLHRHWLAGALPEPGGLEESAAA